MLRVGGLMLRGTHAGPDGLQLSGRGMSALRAMFGFCNRVIKPLRKEWIDYVIESKHLLNE